jgi:hypothetical protein
VIVVRGGKLSLTCEIDHYVLPAQGEEVYGYFELDAATGCSAPEVW